MTPVRITKFRKHIATACNSGKTFCEQRRRLQNHRLETNLKFQAASDWLKLKQVKSNAADFRLASILSFINLSPESMEHQPQM
jgi:acetone carboxylase gamma subunit